MALAQKITVRLRALRARLIDTIDHMHGTNRFVMADFEQGGATLCRYLKLHRSRYHRSVGAHLIIQLHEAGPEVFAGFFRKHSRHGWHFTLTHDEAQALRRARDLTRSRSRISNLRYSTNVFEMLTNSQQLVRMLGLGAVAGSAGILLGLGQILFFAKEKVKELLASTLGISFADPAAQNAEYADLARAITEGAVAHDGSLDAGVIASRIAELVTALEEGGSAETALRHMTNDSTYIVGVLSGIAFLIIGRGLIQLSKGWAGRFRRSRPSSRTSTSTRTGNSAGPPTPPRPRRRRSRCCCCRTRRRSGPRACRGMVTGMAAGTTSFPLQPP